MAQGPLLVVTNAAEGLEDELHEWWQSPCSLTSTRRVDALPAMPLIKYATHRKRYGAR